MARRRPSETVGRLGDFTYRSNSGSTIWRRSWTAFGKPGGFANGKETARHGWTTARELGILKRDEFVAWPARYRCRREKQANRRRPGNTFTLLVELEPGATGGGKKANVRLHAEQVEGEA